MLAQGPEAFAHLIEYQPVTRKSRLDQLESLKRFRRPARESEQGSTVVKRPAIHRIESKRFVQQRVHLGKVSPRSRNRLVNVAILVVRVDSGGRCKRAA